MPHPAIDNLTAFAADALHLVDEEFRPLLTVVVKATLDILPGGGLARSAEQLPIDLGGRFERPDADGESSYRFEPEAAPFKPATDVVLVGHAHAPRASTTTMDIRFRVGPVAKSARVHGDRTWYRSLTGARMTAPAAFDRMPIIHERAFGGWDRGHADAREHRCEPRNPVGRGFHTGSGARVDGAPLPNIEDPGHPIGSVHDAPRPAGFGFISPNWQPRARLAGTYDAAWSSGRCPLLPLDFDRRHFNAASPGLVAPGHLRGDEEVQAVGLSPEPTLNFRLPGVAVPTVRVVLRHGPDHAPALALDTVIVDLDARRLIMLWRASVPLRDGPHELRAVAFESPASHALPRVGTCAGPAVAANQAHGR